MRYEYIIRLRVFIPSRLQITLTFFLNCAINLISLISIHCAIYEINAEPKNI